MQFCEEFISFLCTVIHTMSVFMCGVCLQGVWCGTEIGEVPVFFTAQAAGLSGTGPGDEACEKFAEMFHSTMVRIVRWVISHSFTSLPLSLTFPVDLLILLLYFISALFLFLFSILLSIHTPPPRFTWCLFLVLLSQKPLIRGNC